MTDDDTSGNVRIDLTPRTLEPEEVDLVREVLALELPEYTLVEKPTPRNWELSALPEDFSPPINVLAAHARKILEGDGRDVDNPATPARETTGVVRVYHARRGAVGPPVAVVIEVDLPNHYAQVLGIG